MTDPKHRFWWLDLQCTALEPKPGTGGILEVAWAWVDDAPEGSLEIVEEGSIIVYHDPAERIDDDRIRKIHTDSGLLAECARSAIMPYDLDPLLLGALVDQGGWGVRDVQLAGWGPSLDFAWLRARCPETSRRLHFRAFDASSIEAAAGAWLPGYHEQRPTARRSPENIRQTIAITRRWREAVGL